MRSGELDRVVDFRRQRPAVEIESPDRHVRVWIEEVMKNLQVLGLEVGGDHALAAQQKASHVAHPGADLEHAAPDVGLELLPHPAVVTGDLLHALQDAVSGALVFLVVDEGVAQDRRDRGEAVLPADLLAFPIVAAVVGNGDLVYPKAEAGDLGGDLGLDAEAVRAQPHALHHLARHHFVAGLHVGKVQVGDEVREQREEAVGELMPEAEHAPRPSEEAGAVDHVGSAVTDRLDQLVVILGIVFEVGVLDHDDVASRFFESSAHGRSLAAVVGLVEDPAVRLGGERGEELAGTVGRRVVDDEDLLVEPDCPDALQAFLDGRAFVVDRDDDGNSHGAGGDHHRVAS